VGVVDGVEVAVGDGAAEMAPACGEDCSVAQPEINNATRGTPEGMPPCKHILRMPVPTCGISIMVL
jgi:hypothetical protein